MRLPNFANCHVMQVLDYKQNAAQALEWEFFLRHQAPTLVRQPTQLLACFGAHVGAPRLVAVGLKAQRRHGVGAPNDPLAVLHLPGGLRKPPMLRAHLQGVDEESSLPGPSLQLCTTINC